MARVNQGYIVLANVNSRSRSLYAVARPSVVCLSLCNTRAPVTSSQKRLEFGIL